SPSWTGSARTPRWGWPSTPGDCPWARRWRRPSRSRSIERRAPSGPRSCATNGGTRGLVWSTRESLARAIAERKGIYWSRSRQALWEKGATSGNTQQLMRVDPDCDRDALRFTVRQHGAGFCHLERRACWPAEFALDDLERTVVAR